MLANVLLAGEVCQTLSGPADGNICSVFIILLIDCMLKHRNTFLTTCWRPTYAAIPPQ